MLDNATIQTDNAASTHYGDQTLTTGILLGAPLDMGSVAKDWLNDMRKYDHIVELLGKRVPA